MDTADPNSNVESGNNYNHIWDIKVKVKVTS